MSAIRGHAGFGQNRAKIIATLGPASENHDTLVAMVRAGVNVIRLNMSHGTHEAHRKRIELVRSVSAEMNTPLAILGDLQGPKIRTGTLKDHKPIPLEEGAEVILTTAQHEGSEGIITTNYKELPMMVDVGSTILMDDGHLRLEVVAKLDDQNLRCRVVQGGMLNENKGINVPNALPGGACSLALTEKDRADALFCLNEGVDYLALSFVCSAGDIQTLRSYIRDNYDGPCPPIIAKIEKAEALSDMDSILASADGLMVARGDLGVELSPQRVPIIQKQLIDMANKAEKPVIVATQMLESMIQNIQPTRAEVSDVANAVFDGADAVMLSGESAMGRYPVVTVDMMRRIIEEAEKNFQALRRNTRDERKSFSPNFYHAIAHSAAYAAERADAKAIVVLSTSGRMAQRISKLKPRQKIIALTPDPHVYQRLSLMWGVTPLVIPFKPSTDETLALGEAAILENKLLAEGDSVVFCAGNTSMLGATNMLKIYEIGRANGGQAQPAHQS